MKFSCTQENLSKGITTVARVASRAGNLPILSNIHIKAEAEGVFLKATNLEIGVTCAVRGKIEEIGEITVPAKLFAEYLAFLPKEKVDITLEGTTVEITCGKHHTKIKGVPAGDFPLIPTIEQGTGAQVSLADLVEGLNQILFTVSPSETRPEISGALIRIEGETCKFAGTDSYRLAEKTIKAQVTGATAQAIVPLRALQELSRICAQEKEEGSVKLLLSQSQLAVVLPGTEFVSRVIEGQYPDYRAIVPNKFKSSVKVSRGEFASALKAAGLFSKAGVYDVGVEIDPSKKIATVSALNAQTGEYISSLEAEGEGASAKVAFNWKFLLDGVNALAREKITLQASDSASPAMLTEEGSSDYFYIVMPIKE